MDNPFQAISDAFQPEYRVNLSIERLDGSIMLTLSNETGVVAKRMISAAQRNDPQRVKRLIDSIKFGIAIEQGHSAMEILAAMTDGDALNLPTPPAKGWLHNRPGLQLGI
ncbi:hypothetical protein PMM47T1_17390 [Pseudomonas sp. M47T1]|uniref:DUF3509 domain-containing protein n=1 Tax=unclassified Pseudomonas TaxID=196821 RepID=UPI0002608D87|nr:DUF3509 domain-containing protein [Pseudomonas sp. M47T1]EIK95291.1 hypothetical protein PMM47T1_17390 [Pseudomonas sp. M47T1]